MVWDLRGALLKKQEVETARLADFDFRLRARTMRLLAGRLGFDVETLVGRIAEADDEAILASLDHPDTYDGFARCRAIAEEQLKRELGDPAPHRLA
jgi:hypothetical protein